MPAFSETFLALRAASEAARLYHLQVELQVGNTMLSLMPSPSAHVQVRRRGIAQDAHDGVDRQVARRTPLELEAPGWPALLMGLDLLRARLSATC